VNTTPIEQMFSYRGLSNISSFHHDLDQNRFIIINQPNQSIPTVAPPTTSSSLSSSSSSSAIPTELTQEKDTLSPKAILCKRLAQFQNGK